MRFTHFRRIGATIGVGALLAIGLSSMGARADTTAPDIDITATPSIDMLGDPTGTVSITVTSVPAGADDLILRFGGRDASQAMAMTVTEGSQTLPQSEDSVSKFVDLGTPSAGEQIELSLAISEATAPTLVLAANLTSRETGARVGPEADAFVSLLQPTIEPADGSVLEADNEATPFPLSLSNTMAEAVPADRLRLYFPASGLVGHSAAQVAAALRVTYETSFDEPPARSLPWSIGSDGSLVLDIPNPQLPADISSNGQDAALFFTMSYGLASSYLSGEAQWVAADGSPYATTAYHFSINKRAPAPGPRDVTGDGKPDLLARDSAGGLWLYPGTGNPVRPFGAREKIGHGWEIYDTVFDAGDLNSDGHDDLIGIDKAGVMWAYRGTGKASAPYGPRAEIGHGWGIYRTVIPVGDVNNDQGNDLLAVDASGRLWEYRGENVLSASTFQHRVLLSDANWLTSTIVGIGDATDTFDGHAGILREIGGILYYYPTIDPVAGTKGSDYIGGGWNAYNQFVPTGDLNNDGHVDLVTRDTAGKLWLYLGTGNSAHLFQPRVQIGHGWQIYNLLF